VDLRVAFDSVSKKFRRGERHDSLRDLVPAMAAAFLNRRRSSETLGDQEFWALRNVSFEVRAGEALGIIGPNGAGKSTSLKVLTKLLRPTTGSCMVHGRVGALIEVAAGFHPDLSGRENIYLQGAIMGMKRAEIARRFDDIVDFAGVNAFVDTPVKRYSSGMNARLGFSIAAHLMPDVLIIDEVLSVGDMAFQQRCFDRMVEFKKQGIAIVLVSHNLQAVSRLCDTAVYLASSVKASGPTIDVLDAYVRDSNKLEPTVDDGAIELRSIAFVLDGGPATTHRDVAPGAALRLRVEARSAHPQDDVTFGFEIYRSTDQLLVYNGQVHRHELGSPDDFNGEFHLDLAFQANLVRGHYYISFCILHNPTQAYLVQPRQVGTLAVAETRSRSGVADVDFSAALSLPVGTPARR
jgi:ABC-type polysaccharide/polyol phosphate transport system ATPase subunit